MYIQITWVELPISSDVLNGPISNNISSVQMFISLMFIQYVQCSNHISNDISNI